MQSRKLHKQHVNRKLYVKCIPLPKYGWKLDHMVRMIVIYLHFFSNIVITRQLGKESLDRYAVKLALMTIYIKQ